MIIHDMDFDEADFTLKWPRELFVYEAEQLLRRADHSLFPQRVATLCGEAFAKPDIERIAQRKFSAAIWAESTEEANEGAKAFLEHLVEQREQLQEYVRRRYYAERQNGHHQLQPVEQASPLATRVYHIVVELSDAGYFPEILPHICVDDTSGWEPDPSEKISENIGAAITWPEDVREDRLVESVLYSVIEYLHDEAQRPRRRYEHEFGDCGMHFDDYSKQSGQFIYRWRINKLLEEHDVGLKLGEEGGEAGLLIKYAPLSLDNLASETLTAAPDGERDERGKIESAILAYRRRDASIHDRRKAVASLADVLEYYRGEFKDVSFTRSDESDLFQIFNRFAIRHGKKTERGDYGDEYLDGIFWTTLAAIQLVHRLGADGPPESQE